MTSKKGPATGTPPNPDAPVQKPTHAKNADLTPQKRLFVEWLCSEDKHPLRQYELAAELGVDAATLSDWKRDPIVTGLLAEVEVGFGADKARALANLTRIATGRDAIAAVAAYDKLAKTFGWYKAEKLAVSVDRVSYVEPASLAKLAAERFPELVN